jgi:hypothetical protein
VEGLSALSPTRLRGASLLVAALLLVGCASRFESAENGGLPRLNVQSSAIAPGNGGELIPLRRHRHRGRRGRPVLRRPVAGQLGPKVLLLDHAPKVGREDPHLGVGGRCNFTNRDLDPRAPHRHFLGVTTRTSAARRCRATRRSTSSRWCSGTASRSTRSTRASCSATAAPTIIRMLLAECGAGGVTHWQPCKVEACAGRRRRCTR